MKQQNLVTTTWKGLTPIATIAVIGMGGFAAVRTGLMVGCHIRSEPWESCQSERNDWQAQMAGVAAGFGLLYTKSPGTSEAPAPGIFTTALPPWRRPEDCTEPAPVKAEPPPEPPIVPAADFVAPSVVINPDAEPAEPKLSATERMDRAARRLQR